MAKTKGRGQLSGMPTPKLKPALIKVGNKAPSTSIGRCCGSKMK